MKHVVLIAQNRKNKTHVTYFLKKQRHYRIAQVDDKETPDVVILRA